MYDSDMSIEMQHVLKLGYVIFFWTVYFTLLEKDTVKVFECLNEKCEKKSAGNITGSDQMVHYM